MRRAVARNKWGLTPFWRCWRRFTLAVEHLTHPGRARRRFPASRADEMLDLAGAERYQHLLAFYTDREKRSLITPEFARATAGAATSDYLAQALARAKGADSLNRWLYVDQSTYLPEDILFKVDIASMANSLECRSPFLDHKLIEFACSLPGAYKLTRAGRHKHILKEAFKDWLPAGFLERTKRGFSVALENWVRNDFSPVLRERLLGQKTLAPCFRQERVETMVEEHLSGRASHSNRLYSLLVLSQWIESFKVPL